MLVGRMQFSRTFLVNITRGSPLLKLGFCRCCFVISWAISVMYASMWAPSTSIILQCTLRFLQDRLSLCIWLFVVLKNKILIQVINHRQNCRYVTKKNNKIRIHVVVDPKESWWAHDISNFFGVILTKFNSFIYRACILGRIVANSEFVVLSSLTTLM